MALHLSEQLGRRIHPRVIGDALLLRHLRLVCPGVAIPPGMIGDGHRVHPSKDAFLLLLFL